MTDQGVRFSRAIVRPPADSFAGGLTVATLGAPDLALARVQHAQYCAGHRLQLFGFLGRGGPVIDFGHAPRVAGDFENRAFSASTELFSQADRAALGIKIIRHQLGIVRGKQRVAMIKVLSSSVRSANCGDCKNARIGSTSSAASACLRSD